LLRANHHARGFNADLNPVGAVVAFLGGVVIGIDVEGVVGTSLHARLAADTTRRVEINDSVLALEQR
jgi:hypothetical protein